jgi:cellulose synthase/poly-beta-1,6-N-acetylglucosamine synthase-like glycosyltransferase
MNTERQNTQEPHPNNLIEPKSDPDERAPDRAVRDPHTTYSLITSSVFLITAILVLTGLVYVAATTHVLWIQALLALLIFLWVLMVVQNVRLALVSLLGILLRLGLIPLDYLFSTTEIESNELPSTTLLYDSLTGDELIPTTNPNMPSLTVLIPAVNEEEDLIRRGIDSVRTVRYNGPLKIFLLDDSKDGKFKDLARAYNVEYVARPVKIHGKAGNLNYTLRNYVDTELFFVMDCDYQIVDRDIFTKMVAVMDDGTALVQAPQRYMNVADSKASRFAEIENVIWFDTINLHQDRYNIVPYHGTNSVVRTEALREVGYLDEESAVDDFPTYGRMLLRGWKTAYIPDIVMEGSAPKDLQGLLKQRKKWAMGMGKSFVSVGHKLIGRKGVIQSIHHWCNFTWFAWPLTNLAYSVLLSVFVVLQYLNVFTIPTLAILVLVHLVASISLLFFLGGKKYGVPFLKMLSMDFLLTYEYGYNFIRGMFGARTDVLTPKSSSGLGPSQMLRLAIPIVCTSGYFLAITYVALQIPQPFYAAFGAYNAVMYSYSLTNLRSKAKAGKPEDKQTTNSASKVMKSVVADLTLVEPQASIAVGLPAVQLTSWNIPSRPDQEISESPPATSYQMYCYACGHRPEPNMPYCDHCGSRIA